VVLLQTGVGILAEAVVEINFEITFQLA